METNQVDTISMDSLMSALCDQTGVFSYKSHV